MIVIADLNEIPPPTSAQPIIDKIVQHARAVDLLDKTFILIIEAGDTEAAIADELGFNPLHDPIDRIRFDAPGFEPYWLAIEKREGWYCLIHPVGNDAFAYVLLIEAAGDGPFYAMCRGTLNVEHRRPHIGNREVIPPS